MRKLRLLKVSGNIHNFHHFSLILARPLLLLPNLVPRHTFFMGKKKIATPKKANQPKAVKHEKHNLLAKAEGVVTGTDPDGVTVKVGVIKINPSEKHPEGKKEVVVIIKGDYTSAHYPTYNNAAKREFELLCNSKGVAELLVEYKDKHGSPIYVVKETESVTVIKPAIQHRSEHAPADFASAATWISKEVRHNYINPLINCVEPVEAAAV